MAAATITKQALPHSSSHFNLTDATFTTLTSGAGNGVKFAHEDDLILVLKNDTGGSATFTLKLPTQSRITGYGGTVTDPTVIIATGKTYMLRLETLFRDGSDGFTTVECNVAGKALLLDP